MKVDDVPRSPGVYAFYRNGQRMYVGRAVATGGLRKRLLKMHLITTADLSWSAFRRNVAETLGVPTSITRPHGETLDSEQLGNLNDWIARCEVAWIECDTAENAETLEQSLKEEFTPPLTKR